MTDLYIVRFLCGKMGEKEPFGLVWEENPLGGLRTELNGVEIQLYGGNESPIILRMLLASGKEYLIWEPRLPRESVRKFLGRFSLWLSNSKSKEEEDSRAELRKSLETLLDRALKDFFSKGVSFEERRERNKREIFEKLIGKGL